LTGLYFAVSASIPVRLPKRSIPIRPTMLQAAVRPDKVIGSMRKVKCG
jgi:hypothetical protein